LGQVKEGRAVIDLSAVGRSSSYFRSATRATGLFVSFLEAFEEMRKEALKLDPTTSFEDVDAALATLGRVFGEQGGNGNG
jgi:hypothetical protein